MSVTEPFLTLYCDPGEDFGWALGKGTKLLARGTAKMWTFADMIWEKLEDPRGDAAQVDPSFPDLNPLSSLEYAYPDTTLEDVQLPVERIVCEDFRIYPWLAKELAFDQVRTARVIGAITFMCRQKRIPLVLQGANIKSAAVAAGAEELYDRPLKENRHSNDALQHFCFFTNVELMGVKLPVPDSVTKEDFQ